MPTDCLRRCVVIITVILSLGAVAPAQEDSDHQEKLDAAHAKLKATLFAGESMLGSPIAISVDDHGNVFVTVTTRRRSSDLDYRGGPEVAKVLSLSSTEERRAFLHERFATSNKAGDLNKDGKKDWRDLAVQSEQIIELRDTDGDGTADKSIVYADGFNNEVTGVAAGVLAFDGDVYLTCIPDLWKLRDTNGDGKVDERKILSTGYGVKCGYSGHDMHGLTIGPDGKIYWSLADKGANVTTPDGRKLVYTHTGTVWRCNPDGSELEVYAYGLRNPQEIAFDEYGYLFNVDNDGDFPGERERVVYIAEGSDSGWRNNWQYRGQEYNPWMNENMWKPREKGQAAYFLAPIANYSSGPCGFKYEPGTALSDRFRGRFFLTEAPSGVLSMFTLTPKGAGFEMGEPEVLYRGLVGAGITFGPDGDLYVADWLGGWVPQGKGKVWKLDDAATPPSPARLETQKLLNTGMDQREVASLKALLGHADMRVRQAAQFELVKRGLSGDLWAVAKDTKAAPLARIHAMWGLAELSHRKGLPDGGSIADLMHDDDAHVREQAAKVAGDARQKDVEPALIAALADDSARVRYQAAIALGKVGMPAEVGPVVKMIEANNDADQVLRHAGAYALAGIGDANTVVALCKHSSTAVRLAAVIALRRMADPGVAVFLDDADESVVAEAARAIHDDRSIPAALPALAKVLERTGLRNVALLRRAINANLRLGEPADAQRLIDYAADSAGPIDMRAEALAALSYWNDKLEIDRVEGVYRPLPGRDVKLIYTMLDKSTALTAADCPDAVRAAAATAAGKLHYGGYNALLPIWVADPKAAPVLHMAALSAMANLHHPLLKQAVDTAIGDGDKNVRIAAVKLMTQTEGGNLVDALKKLLNGETSQQQAALAVLGDMPKDKKAVGVLNEQMDQLLTGKIPAEIQLDLIEAAKLSKDNSIKKKLDKYESAKSKSDPLAAYSETLVGGDADRGRVIFTDNLAAGCIRCHSISDAPNPVAPNLSKVGQRAPRSYLLQSLIEPSAVVVEGFGVASVTLKNGTTVSGFLRKEDKTTLTIAMGDGSLATVAVSDIASRAPVVSVMPPMGAILTKAQIRDVIEFLSTLN